MGHDEQRLAQRERKLRDGLHLHDRPETDRYQAGEAGDVEAETLREWVNAKLGKTQRLADLVFLDNLPRSHIGKVLKRELRDDYKGKALG